MSNRNGMGREEPFRRGLALRRLEEHHRRDIWDRLGLPPGYDYAWFRWVQEEAGDDSSPHTLCKLLSNVHAVVRQLPAAGMDVERAVRAAADASAGVRPENRAALRRRLYLAANLAWHQTHGAIERPLTLPRTRRTFRAVPAHTRVFSLEDVDQLRRAAADKFTVYDRLLIEILFTTGLRIAAVAGFRWGQVLASDGDTVARVCVALRVLTDRN